MASLLGPSYKNDCIISTQKSMWPGWKKYLCAYFYLVVFDVGLFKLLLILILKIRIGERKLQSEIMNWLVDF